MAAGMRGGEAVRGGGDEPAAGDPGRLVRADARRNVEALVQAARRMFEAEGVDAPMRQIADAAGVGVGTLYRHFPRRADLIVAVFRHEVEACAEAAALLAAAHPPAEALRLWVDRYVALIAAKRGLAGALHGDEAAYEGLPAWFEARLSPALDGLLRKAGGRGGAADLLWAIASLCVPPRHGDTARSGRMIALLLEAVLGA